jgi:hypothetical protein
MLSKNRMVVVIVLALTLNACSPTVGQTPTPTAETNQPAAADLSGIKRYVEKQSAALHDSIVRLKSLSDQYYTLAQGANFDYGALWAQHSNDVRTLINEARATFIIANPQYERMEGIVAGVPDLSQYDIALDAGTAGGNGVDNNAVPFDLNLPDGRILPKPGNLFEVTEATLWGTDPAYTVAGLTPDFNANGQVDLGDAMPDANVLKAAADAFEKYSADLQAAAKTWEPTETQAFGALVTNVPTFSNFMDGWKNSRFVAGNKSQERGFVATSRLSDLSDNVLSWQTIYQGLSPSVNKVAPDQDTQIVKDLEDLHKFVSDLHTQEKNGKRFTPDEADLFSAEGQNRATAIAGQISQVAALLGIFLDNP